MKGLSTKLSKSGVINTRVGMQGVGTFQGSNIMMIRKYFDSGADSAVEFYYQFFGTGN